MASLSNAKFKRIFYLKRGHKGQFSWKQKNTKMAAILEYGVCMQNTWVQAREVQEYHGGRTYIYCLALLVIKVDMNRVLVEEQNYEQLSTPLCQQKIQHSLTRCKIPRVSAGLN